MRPRDNPFASRRVDSLVYRFRTSNLDEILARLAEHRGRGAIVGPHGSGKTTLLDVLADHIDGETVRIRLSAETTRAAASCRDRLPCTITELHTVFVDGAEQLGPWSWWRLARRLRPAGIVIITTHRPGRLPTIHSCSTDPELLRDLVTDLAPEILGEVDLDALFHRHGGNLRDCFRELYDLCSKRESFPGNENGAS